METVLGPISLFLGMVGALVMLPFSLHYAERTIKWLSTPRPLPSRRRGVTDLSGMREEPKPEEPVYWPTDEEIRADRLRRHREALQGWDLDFLRALPEAERDAMEDTYRRVYPRLAASARLQNGDTAELDLSTPEGMALAEMLEAEEERTKRLWRSVARARGLI